MKTSAGAVTETKWDQQCLEWLAELLDPDRFDILIPVERKATAVLRSLLDLSPEIECRWDWGKVLSSDALQYLPPGYLRGKRILLFNEMIHHGHSTKRAIDAIESNTPTSTRRVETAALVVFEGFETDGCWRTKDFREGEGLRSPDFAMIRSVSEQLYGVLRERLIFALSEKGALLLDTEHLESTFKLTMPIRTFLEALSRFGKPVEYRDEARPSFPGLTIRNPTVPDLARLWKLLPDGTLLSEMRAPRKIRVVRRGPQELAFIPIWYPPVRNSNVNEWRNAPDYLKTQLVECPEATRGDLIFHLVSLITGVELLRSLWAGLRPFIGKGIEPLHISGAIDPGSPLGHLRALYPLIDFKGLEDVLARTLSAYNDRALAERVEKASGFRSGSNRPVVVDAEARLRETRRLLVELMRQRATTTFDEESPWLQYLRDRIVTRGEGAFTWSEVWEMGEGLQIPEDLRSIIMDTAIDNAILKPLSVTKRDQSESYTVRAYKPDNEFALKQLERMAYGAEEVLAYG